jgi:hypothetical protein
VRARAEYARLQSVVGLRRREGGYLGFENVAGILRGGGELCAGRLGRWGGYDMLLAKDRSKGGRAEALGAWNS